MTSLLERRYRLYLRLLPAWYRERWEEEMVTALLDKQPDHGRPRLGEVLSVFSLSLRLRLGGVRATSRAGAWDGVPYRLALLGMLCYSAVGIGAAAISGLDVFRPGPELPEGAIQEWLVLSRRAVPMVELLWLGAFLALLFERLRPARWLAVIAFVYPVASEVAISVLGPPLLLSRPWTILGVASLAWLAIPVLAVLLVRRPVPVRRRAWLFALAGSAVVVFPTLEEWGGVWSSDPFVVISTALAAGIMGLLIANGLGRPGAAPWLLVLAIPCVAAAALRLLNLYFAEVGYPVPLLIGTVQAALAGLVALVALVLGTTTTAREHSVGERS